MKKKIECVIVDDDHAAISLLEDYISQFPILQVKNTYTRPVEALADILETGADLIFLDIDMPVLSGIQLAESLKNKLPNIIFTTAFASYAIKAFDVRAKHFLLKPIELSKFAEVVSTVMLDCFDEAALSSPEDNSLYLRTGERGKLTKIITSDIIHIQAAGNYVQLLTEKDQFTIYMTIKEMEDKLQDDPFFYRVHKSNIINSRFVKRITGNTINLGKYEVIMSAQYKHDFAAYLQNKTLVSKRN